jgi:hypothetical protein
MSRSKRKAVSLADRKALLRQARSSAGPGREVEREAFDELVLLWGLSRDNAEDGWTVAFALFREWTRHMRVFLPPEKVAGRKTTRNALVRDALMLVQIRMAREAGDIRGEEHIIRELAAANGWRSDKAAINTMWRRYQDIKRVGSPVERRFSQWLSDYEASARVAPSPQSTSKRCAPPMRKFGRDSA